MNCVDVLALVASGVLIVPLLTLLKLLPKVGAFVEQWAMWIAPLLSALAPLVAQALSPMCAKIEPGLWLGMYWLATYAISQMTYWLGKQAGINV